MRTHIGEHVDDLGRPTCACCRRHRQANCIFCRRIARIMGYEPAPPTPKPVTPAIRTMQEAISMNPWMSCDPSA